MKTYDQEDLFEIISLFRKSLLGVMNDDESVRLDELLSDDSLHALYLRLSDKDFIDAKFRELESFPARPAYEQFLKIYRKRRFFRRLTVSVSAAVVAAAIAVAVVLLVPKNTDPQTIEPGKKVAVLTLSDGRVISIDEHTVMPDDLGVVPRLSQNGELIYNRETVVAETGYNQIYIPLGGEYRVHLGDGTTVWLNADSRLRYPVTFTGGERRVSLTGEAYFEVAHAEYPFIVETDRGEVRVLGTWFGVSAYRGETEYTTLVKGCVCVASETDEIMLGPGEQALLSVHGELSKRVVEVDEYVGWKSGKFVFRDKPLGEIMRILDRWYGVATAFNDPSLAEIKYTGDLMRYESINTFLEFLTRLNGIDYRIDENKILLYR